jgi:hypothetical protein
MLIKSDISRFKTYTHTAKLTWKILRELCQKVSNNWDWTDVMWETKMWPFKCKWDYQVRTSKKFANFENLERLTESNEVSIRPVQIFVKMWYSQQKEVLYSGTLTNTKGKVWETKSKRWKQIMNMQITGTCVGTLVSRIYFYHEPYEL